MKCGGNVCSEWNHYVDSFLLGLSDLVVKQYVVKYS